MERALTANVGTIRRASGECAEVVIVAVLPGVEQFFTLSSILIPPVANIRCRSSVTGSLLLLADES